MDPSYDLTDVNDALRFLDDHSRRAGYHPPGHEHVTVKCLANLADLAEHADQGESMTGDEALASLTLLADLRAWLARIEPVLIGAARAASVTWDELAPVLGVGDRRAAQRRHSRLTTAQAVLQDGASTHAGPVAGPVLVTPPRVGHDWDDTDVCLSRIRGRWGLRAPNGVMEAVGAIAADDVKAAKSAAAAAVTALTGRAVAGWTREAIGRTPDEPSSWYARLA